MEPTKIASIDAVLKDIPKEGIIELKSIYFKDRQMRVEPTKDKVTGLLKGIPVVSEEDRKKINYCTSEKTVIVIRDGFTFDLSKYEDRLHWAMVKECPFIGEGFDEAQNTPGCGFYVNNEAEQLKTEMEEEDQMYKALSLIHEDKKEELIGRARLLGFDMTGESSATAKKLLLKELRAEGGIQRIMHLYTSSVITTTLVFYKAVDKGIIKRTNGVYMFGTQPLGADDDVTIDFLQAPSNKELMDEIKKQINPEVYGKAAPKTKQGSREK